MQMFYVASDKLCANYELSSTISLTVVTCALNVLNAQDRQIPSSSS